MSDVITEQSRTRELERLLRERIVILDGAMGTMIQAYKLDEAAFRGERFKDWPQDLKGNNDLLNLTQPQIIQAIHRAIPRSRARTSSRPTRSTPPRSRWRITGWRGWLTS